MHIRMQPKFIAFPASAEIHKKKHPHNIKNKDSITFADTTTALESIIQSDSTDQHVSVQPFQVELVQISIRLLE